MNLNELKIRAYEIACEHGWYEAEQSDETLLMLIVTEISEAVNADRNGIEPDIDGYKEFIEAHDESAVPYAFNHFIKGCKEEELADVVIRCLSMAGSRNLDLSMAHDMMECLDELKPNITFPEVCYIIASLTTAEIALVSKISSVLAVVLKYCECKGIDIEWFVEQKMRYNALRPYKHGGKKY